MNTCFISQPQATMAVPELVYPENFTAVAEAGIFYAALPQASALASQNRASTPARENTARARDPGLAGGPLKACSIP
jgi:hypothetical protein